MKRLNGSTSVAPAASWTRADWVCAGLVALLAVALWVPRLRGPIDLRYDAGVYYILGTSLADGHGYRLLNEPGHIQAVQYPPGLPALVALHERLLGSSDPVLVGHALRFTYFGLSLLLYVAVYAAARCFVAWPYALIAAAIFGLYEETYFLSDLLFAELPFTLVAVGCLLCIRRARLGQPGKGVWEAAGGAAAVAGYLLRSAGVALLAAWAAEALLRRRWKLAVARGAVAVLPVLLWQGYVTHISHSAAYQRVEYAYQRAPYQYYNVTYAANMSLIDPFAPERGRMTTRTWARRIVWNTLKAPLDLGEAVSSPRGYWQWLIDSGGRRVHVALLEKSYKTLATVLLLALGAIVLGGLVILVIRREWFIPALAAATLGTVYLTPWPGQFGRYLAPLSPFLCIALIVALGRIAGAARARRPAMAWVWWVGAGLVLAIVFGTQFFALARTYARRHNLVRYTSADGRPVTYELFHYDPAWRKFDAGLDWLAQHAGPGQVVVTSAPHWTYLRTGLPAVMPPMEIDADRAQRLLDSIPARYLILDKLGFITISQRYAAPAVTTHASAWNLIYADRDGSVRIFQRRPNGAGSATAPPTTRRP